MRRPRTLKAAKHRAWRAISNFVRSAAADDEGYAQCVTCGNIDHWKNLHAGHYVHGLTYGKDKDGPFVWVENVHPQCAGCNTYRNGQLHIYTLWMVDMYGRDFTEGLIVERHKPVKMSIDDYWKIEREFYDALEA